MHEWPAYIKPGVSRMPPCTESPELGIDGNQINAILRVFVASPAIVRARVKEWMRGILIETVNARVEKVAATQSIVSGLVWRLLL